jgi:CheY-like chemotaxis protein
MTTSASNGGGGRVKTVLGVDDSPTIRKLVVMTLENAYYNVVTAEDGMQAMQKLESVTPDIVLLDISMPMMSGYEVCSSIRKNPKLAHIPVIMLTGKEGNLEKDMARQAGATAYLTKPFNPDQLLEVVNKYANYAEKALAEKAAKKPAPAPGAAKPQMLRVRCPRCQKAALFRADQAAGRVLKCPHCEMKFKVKVAGA